MYSSSAEAAPSPARWRTLLSGDSIGARISRLYTLSAVIILGVVVGLLYWVESESLEWDDVYFLVDKVQELRSVLHKHADEPRFLQHEVIHQGGVYSQGQYYVFYARVMDASGRVLLETPGASERLPAALFPQPVAVDTFPKDAKLAKGTDGRDYLLMSAWATTGGAQPERRLLQVALDDALEKEFIAAYRRHSMILVLIGILLSARVAVMIARGSMRPLQRIARVAEEITASQLHRRLQGERWPAELAALARAFDGMLARLDESHTRLAHFSADLAHELRTPIQVLMGQTEVALTKPRRPDEYRQVLESNLEEFHRLARMINGLLFIARAEDPKVQIQPVRLDGRTELEAIREFYEALSEDHGVTVACEGHGEVHADPVLLRRAVTNLLSNALRHTRRGGRIVLALQPHAGGTVVGVADNGCGIRAEDLPRVGERLFSGQRHKTRCGEGLGLGFAIVKSIAELHGGHVSIESTPGKGTRVALFFPAQPHAARAIDPPVAAGAASPDAAPDTPQPVPMRAAA